jgi:hypothetical protein
MYIFAHEDGRTTESYSREFEQNSEQQMKQLRWTETPEPHASHDNL